MSFDSLFSLKGRIALVVGAGSGIGRSASLGLADFGAKVVCADLKEGEAAAAAKAIVERGGRAEACFLDVRDAAGVKEEVHRIRVRHGPIDVLVATPGINIRKSLSDYRDEEWDEVIDVNLKGNLRLLREVAPIMAAEGKGSIILLSSIRSRVVEPGQGVYAATKAGVVQLAKTLAAELGSQGVRVNVLAPGVVHTPLTQPIRQQKSWYDAYASKNALGRWAEADEMVGPIVFLASDASSYVTGTVLLADGGWTAIDGRFVPPL